MMMPLRANTRNSILILLSQLLQSCCNVVVLVAVALRVFQCPLQHTSIYTTQYYGKLDPSVILGSIWG